VLVVVLGLVGISTASASKTSAPSSGTSTVKAFMTLYGYVDNSPAGTDIAHPCGARQGAGGAGTYADPITFATDVSEMPWCVIIYVPYMERYFIHEDECSQCDTDWNKFRLYRFDMWAGGDSASLQEPERDALLACENTWTRADSVSDPDNPTILINPPSGLPVTTSPIFSAPTSCWQPVSETNPGKQRTALGTPVTMPITATDTSPDRTLTYSAVGLPAGLSISPRSGVITGSPTKRRSWRVAVTASDAYNAAVAKFTWVVSGRTRNRSG
jgi:Putative Ig domain